LCSIAAIRLSGPERSSSRNTERNADGRTIPEWSDEELMLEGVGPHSQT